MSEMGSAVSGITKEPLKVIFDSIAAVDTQNTAYDILAHGGTLITSLSSQVKKSVVGKDVVAPFGSVFAPSHRAFGVELLKVLPELLERDEFKVCSFLSFFACATY